MLSDLLPKSASCKIRLIGGEEIEISFRPFTLRDLAWMQDEFDTQKGRSDLAKMKAEAVCKVIWYMMKPESKALFKNIEFVDFDEETQEEKKVLITGYEKLLHSFYSQEDMLSAWIAYSETENLNNFLPEFAKKKILT
jgi:hypothetical protein